MPIGLGVSHCTLLMFTYHRGALSGSDANAATEDSGAAILVRVVTSTFIASRSPSGRNADECHFAGRLRAASAGIPARLTRLLLSPAMATSIQVLARSTVSQPPAQPTSLKAV